MRQPAKSPMGRDVPGRFTQIALSTKTVLNISILSIKEVTGRLKAAGQTRAYSGRIIIPGCKGQRRWQSSSTCTTEEGGNGSHNKGTPCDDPRRQAQRRTRCSTPSHTVCTSGATSPLTRNFDGIGVRRSQLDQLTSLDSQEQ
jgi:hypothetical protein